MSQAINQAVQYGSSCFLLGGLAAQQQRQVEGSAVRLGAVKGQGVGAPTRGFATQRCVLLQPRVRHPILSLAHAVRCTIRGWRQ